VDSRRRTACEPVSCLISRPEASCECDTAAPNAKLVGVLTTCAFENTQHRFQWSSSKYTRVVSAKSEGLVSAVSWQSRGEWRLAVSVERASCCVGPSVAVCVAVCERLRREVWRECAAGARAAGERPHSHGDRAVARSRVLASPLCACSCCSCAARRDHMHVRSGSRARSDGDTGGKSEGTEAGRMCTQGFVKPRVWGGVPGSARVLVTCSDHERVCRLGSVCLSLSFQGGFYDLAPTGRLDPPRIALSSRGELGRARRRTTVKGCRRK